MSRLQEQYKNELAGEIQKKLGLENVSEVPKITKITLNMGVGEAIADKKVLEKAVCQSVARLRCAVSACTSFSIAS